LGPRIEGALAKRASLSLDQSANPARDEIQRRRAPRLLAERLSIKPSKAAVSIDTDQGP